MHTRNLLVLLAGLETLEAEGLTTITGLAFAGATDVLWALDGDTDQLHQFRLQD